MNRLMPQIIIKHNNNQNGCLFILINPVQLGVSLGKAPRESYMRNFKSGSDDFIIIVTGFEPRPCRFEVKHANY